MIWQAFAEPRTAENKQGSTLLLGSLIAALHTLRLLPPVGLHVVRFVSRSLTRTRHTDSPLKQPETWHTYNFKLIMTEETFQSLLPNPPSAPSSGPRLSLVQSAALPPYLSLTHQLQSLLPHQALYQLPTLSLPEVSTHGSHFPG